jgi:ubiquinone/menaquinone biosynthesis C-methylase UbiE
MPTPDTKQAEKDYLRRSGGGDWEASKPFPPAGQLATEEHAQHLLDFAVLLRVLAPGQADHVLDLGAGSCWVSDWLRRCGVRTVAVDIALDMLRLGAQRLGNASGLVVGDMEQLPFNDGSFSKACCLNAFHHVPDRTRALEEIRRVLAPDGIAMFSEPGKGHAASPTSVVASQNYGVLENEILIEEFMNACLEAGFADVLLHPISNIMPLFVLHRDQWRSWRTFTSSARPTRALDKLWRAVLEFAGLGKGTVLFEEAFAIRLLRELEPVIEQHPIVTAHRRPFVRPTRRRDAAALELVAAASAAPSGTRLPMTLSVRNVGTVRWEAGAVDQVRVGVQLLTPEGVVLNRDHSRHQLPGSVAPGETVTFDVTVPAPADPGRYAFKIDLVREGVSWFELAGSKPVVHLVDVT